MHLASQFLAASLRNAMPEVRTELLKALNARAKRSAGRFGGVEGAAHVFDDEPLETSNDTVRTECPGIVLIEQALRLAALFHDLGHLPFSHDFETALEEVARKPQIGEIKLPPELVMLDEPAGKLHERIGRRLSELILLEIIDKQVPPEKKLGTRIAFELAQEIFDSLTEAPTLEGAAIRWLHTLIDGELDVDRCDYILRDGRNYAFEFAAVDLQRLVGNLSVTKVSVKAKDGVREGASLEAFVPAILPHGLSAVEDFMLARYRSYQHSVRHHKVTQVGAALQHCIAAVISQPHDHRRTVKAFIDDIVFLVQAGTGPESYGKFEEWAADEDKRTEFLNRFASYDDVSWMGILRTYDARDEWFELVCARQSGPSTLWKWIGDFPKGDDVADWNKRLPGKKDETAAGKWFTEMLQLKEEHIIIVRHKFQPWETDDSGEESKLCVLKKDGSLVPVTKLSRLVKSLKNAWSEELQVHAFAGTQCKLTKEEVCNRLNSVMIVEKREEG